MDALNPKKTAVLAIHLQNDIVEEGGAFYPFFQEQIAENKTLEKAAKALDQARDAGATIVYAVVGFKPDYSDMVENVPLLQMGKAAEALIDGAWGTEVAEQVAAAENDIVLVHTRPSPFSGTPLDVMLRGRGIENVVVLGVATNASVEDAARAASNLGYRTIIDSDASSAATAAAHAATLESFALFGECAGTDDIAAAFAQD